MCVFFTPRHDAEVFTTIYIFTLLPPRALPFSRLCLTGYCRFLPHAGLAILDIAGH